MYGIPDDELGLQQWEAKDVCPLCVGVGVIFGKCCNGTDCGCMGLPVDMDCSLCDGLGRVDPLTETQLKELEPRIKEQKETLAWMMETYPKYFKPKE